MPAQASIFARHVRDAMSAPPLMLPLGMECGAAVARMAALAASCAAVVDANGRPIGLLTDQDVTRRIAFQVPSGAPVEAVMNRSVPTVQGSDRLFRAVARMRHQRLRQLLVTDETGHAIGLLDLDAALSLTADGLVRQMDLLAQEDTIAGLRSIKAAEPQLARAMLDDGVPAAEIQAFLTEINRDLYCRIVGRAVAAMADEGWGAPPVAFGVLVMGSAGRGESLLDPDQDNGFVLGDYPDAEHGPIDRFFLELAERMTRDLDAIGVRYCKGGVMATNPLWRKTLTQWRDQIAFWAKRRAGGTTLLADIFFDFQPVYGDMALSAALRRHGAEALRRERALLHSMADDDTTAAIALDMFGRLSREGDDSPHRGRTELKVRARQPLTACVRLLALAAGIEDTSTLRRLERMGALGRMARTDVEDLVDAYDHITTLMLRQQIADHDAGIPLGGYVDTQPLTQRERARLHDALKAIDRLRKRTQMDLLGQAL